MKLSNTAIRCAVHASAAALTWAAVLLAGCAGFSQDGGFDPAARAARSQLGKDLRWTRTEGEQAQSDLQVARLLARPLSAEDAVQVALLNNRALQACFEQLKISESDLVQSGRLPDPRITLRRSAGGGQYDIEQTVSFNVLALLAAPLAHDIDRHRFAEVQDAAVLAVLRLAADTRRAYFAAVAAAQSARYHEQVQDAAQIGAELARRMVAAGNWTALDLAREQSFHADATERLARARRAEIGTHEALVRLLGLSGGAPRLQLADRLEDLPATIADLPDVERAVLNDRIDLKLERGRVDELARALGLARATRFVNVLELGPTRVRQGASSQPYESGYELSLVVPIFDAGAPRLRRAEARYAQAVDRFAQSAVTAGSQIRAAYAAYRAAYGIARQQHDEVIPLRRNVARQELVRFNASLVSVFDLLSDARSQIASVDDYLEDLRDFWTARSDFDAALLGSDSP